MISGSLMLRLAFLICCSVSVSSSLCMLLCLRTFLVFFIFLCITVSLANFGYQSLELNESYNIYHVKCQFKNMLDTTSKLKLRAIELKYIIFEISM